MPKHNGIELGEGSPLLTKGGRKRYLGPSEHEIQSAYITAIKLYEGRISDLATLHAIPNGGLRTKAQAGKLKAEGLVPSIPDIHWPVMRGPFIGLWIEFKIPGKAPTPEQRAMHARLRASGHCVVTCRSVQGGIDATLAYSLLGPNRPSVRPVNGQWPVGTKLSVIVEQWRVAAQLLLDDEAAHD